MEVDNMSKKVATKNIVEEDADDVPLPGFRFHPTDEELVGFYLRRKVEKKPISIELIKQADIYKYDPWDLPKSTNVGEKDKEWYFFCKRGRKYKNSVRPNRVTGSGFWKATGIDRPIYSGRDCIGLKKSLVYYRGSAGKGTKTEWMMHEFRLPAKHMDAIAVNAQEAEVWTLCRILKRNTPYRKLVPDWRLGITKKNNMVMNPIVEAIESSDYNGRISYISFNAPLAKKNINTINQSSQLDQVESSAKVSQISQFSSGLVTQATGPAAAVSWFSNYNNVYGDYSELIGNGDWEDLRAVVDPNASNPMYL
ncbi:hypothetical protein CASFOL_013973 [Castilleja foliolosa]|uniref:NAC domain-containing protein n=1 Tax=Castilleja foliolosa TaxID=1961234 RepID=A0ABD3DM57_9LAMI